MMKKLMNILAYSFLALGVIFYFAVGIKGGTASMPITGMILSVLGWVPLVLSQSGPPEKED